MILVPIFIVLFSSWMLWGWTVGESKNIKWLRRSCAPVFVVTVAIMSAGAGAYIARTVTRNAMREDITNLLTTIELRIRTGGTDKVIAELQALDHSDDPDADAFDALDDVAQMAENLSIKPLDVAEGPRPLKMY
ncbi:MAG TPA: hypothetical protein EYG03_06195 [Planctomycetes bacterium]|nr:hypothetical protein [Fuerstiella sp.]HIK91558.1 hypothetical protein [Planctomycetota bacterium]